MQLWALFLGTFQQEMSKTNMPILLDSLSSHDNFICICIIMKNAYDIKKSATVNSLARVHLEGTLPTNQHIHQRFILSLRLFLEVSILSELIV